MSGLATAPSLIAVGFASAMVLWYGHRKRRTIWHPMSTWWNKRTALLENSRLDELLIITDFDATITTGDSIQCHDMLGFSELMTPAFRHDFAPLLDWASNPATDGVHWCALSGNGSGGSKQGPSPRCSRPHPPLACLCRWDRAHELCIQHGQPPRHLIPRMVRETRMQPRPGALKLLARLAALEVPVLIVSAGLSDVIEEFLRQHDALTENITVCSNRLNYGADSAPQSVSPDPPITSFTKDTAYRASSAFFRQHQKRTKLIVIGDSCSDVDAATNVPHNHALSVGFLNGKEIHNASAVRHLQTYDAIVLGHDGSLEPVDAIIDQIASNDRTVGSSMLSRMQRSVSEEESRRVSQPTPLRATSQRGD